MDNVAVSIRSIGRHFVCPLFFGQKSDDIVNKISHDTAGVSPVGLADVGAQILLAREVSALEPKSEFFGEEFVPRFSSKDRRIVDRVDVTRPFDPSDKNDAAFLDLVRTIIASGQTWPQATIDGYHPAQNGVSWLADPVDGTIPFRDGKPCFSMQLARIDHGRLVGGWIYRPVQDQMFVATEGCPPYVIESDGASTSLTLPAVDRPAHDMRVVYARAHPNVPLDSFTRRIYEDRDGRRLSFDALAKRIGSNVATLLPTDGYSFHLGELFLQNVHAVCVPGTHPWDHFASAYIARRIGYRVGFLNGRSYLSETMAPCLQPDMHGVKNMGGVLYAPSPSWLELNEALNVKPLSSPAPR
ncbi:MAG: hypothetical protein PHS57_04715 [Alphaproteobacteria bacterium]|nr:hypothetical protein [Alphaproteobacteria bacterium]